MSRKKKNSGASVGATAPAPSGASVYIHSKVCLAGEITLRPGMNHFTTSQLEGLSEKTGRQLEKLARAGLLRADTAPPPAPPAPEPPAPPPPLELAGKTPAELEALLKNATSAEEANAITAALAASDADPGLGGPKLPPPVPPVPPAPSAP